MKQQPTQESGNKMDNHTKTQIEQAEAITNNWPGAKWAELCINGNGNYSVQVGHGKNFADIPLGTNDFSSALVLAQAMKDREQAAMDQIDSI